MANEKQWLPLESNPDVMNDYCRGLGVPSTWAFHDVYGFDAELLAMVPQPVHAVLLLFPITPETEQRKAEQEARIAAEGQDVSPRVWFTRQTVGNACGTVGLLHACLNSCETLALAPGSWLARFLEKTAALEPGQRAAALEADSELDSAHASAASAGQTVAPSTDEEVNLHFICFVAVDGGLYELDGRKPVPVRHGLSSAETLLQDAAAVIKRQFVDCSEAVTFNMVALAPAAED